MTNVLSDYVTRRTGLSAAAAAACMGLAGAISGPAYAAPGDVQLVSVQLALPQAAGYSVGKVFLSGDGRYVAFGSTASTLIEGDTNGQADVFVRDLATGVTTRVSAGLGGMEPNGPSEPTGLSKDGRYVAFSSTATNLFAGDYNQRVDGFVFDRVTGVTRRGSLFNHMEWWGGQTVIGNASNDGRLVVFIRDGAVYVRDLQGGYTELVSADTSGSPAYGCDEPAISGNGRYVVFSSDTLSLVPNDTNPGKDLFVRDRFARTTQRINTSVDLPRSGFRFNPAISSDGRWIAFATDLPELARDANRTVDIYVRDRVTGALRLASVGPTGQAANGASNRPSISDDGRYVVFQSYATNLAPHAANIYTADVFLKDMQTGAVQQVNVAPDGTPANFTDWRAHPSVSNDGRFVAFNSYASNLVPNDVFDEALPVEAMVDTFIRESGGPVKPTIYNFALRPRSLDFGAVQLHSTVTRGFTLANLGDTALPIEKVEVLGTALSQYSFRNYCGATVDVGRRCWISVSFKPTSTGYKQANLHVIAGGLDRHRALRGTGVN